MSLYYTIAKDSNKLFVLKFVVLHEFALTHRQLIHGERQNKKGNASQLTQRGHCLGTENLKKDADNFNHT